MAIRLPTAAHGEAWQGDWQARLASELERRGFDSLRAFAERNGHGTYTAIASALEGPFAPIQMMMAIRSEFESNADFVGFVCDSLYRYLSEHTSAPPINAALRESQAIDAVSAVGAAIGAKNDSAILEVSRMLRQKVSNGWLPNSPSDPVLLESMNAATWQGW
jgi:hypothetical protein